MYCAMCQRALIPCPCGSTQYRAKVFDQMVRTPSERNLAQEQDGKRAFMQLQYSSESNYEGILVDRRSPDSHEVQRLRSAGYIKRKAHRGIRWRKYWEHRWARHDRYFSSAEGMAQATEARLVKDIDTRVLPKIAGAVGGS